MIKASEITKQFDKRGIAGVHKMSLNLDQGQVMAIMGPNGSGKSTLLNLLSGRVQPESGDISIDGAISSFPINETLENMNVQKFLIRSITLDIDEEKKIQLSRDLADTFEFTFQLRQNINELSSGQKQKVLLSKELINRPALLLMDEPFAHLDPFTRKDILSGLFQYIRYQGITVLWVTHDLEEAFQFSDQIGLMNFGKFEQRGTPEELVRTPRNLFVAQFMGYRNFFSIKYENGSWQTPWGPRQMAQLAKSDGILIVPDHAWELQSQDGLEVNIETRHPAKQTMEYRLKSSEKVIFLTQGSQLKLLEMGSKIKLSPKWEECFHIAL